MNIREILWSLVVGTILGLLVVFIMLNMLLGCDSWSNPNCLTPKQFMEIVF